MASYELGIVGAGNMAEAILRGCIRANFMNRSAVVASESNADRRKGVANALQIACVADNHVPAACRRVILAVKPQVLPGVLDEIAATVRPDATVVSIAAGISTSLIDQKLKGRGRIVRVMPNTPMLVGCGMSALCPGPRATEEDLNWTQRLFAAGGQAVVVGEAMMDAVTAVSGSGPAYFFYLIEAMIVAGVAEGLDRDVAAKLAAGTCEGAAKLLRESGESAEIVRARVTSPNGTTQRAIETLDAAGVKQKLIDAVRAAAARSRELGK